MNPSSLISLDDALHKLLLFAKPLNRFSNVSTFKADGCVLAQNLVSSIQVPSFDNSAMDGYALRLADLSFNDGVLKLGQRILAGHTA